MLKRFTFKKFSIATLLLLLAIILYNYPEEINEIPKKEDCKKLNIFLIDENDFVALTKINSYSNNIDDKINSIIEALIFDKENESIPEGFKGVLPKNTKLNSFDLKDGLLKLDFNSALLDVSLNNENKVIEALTFSLTSLSEVNKIMVFIDGVHLTELPQSHKKLGLYLDRSYGINKVIDITTFNNTNLVTVYYLNKYNDEYYYVPVSFVSNNDEDKIEIIIKNLKTNKVNGNLLSYLDYQVELMNYEKKENEFLLDFNDALINYVYDSKLMEEVKYAISYSIYDTYGIENVVFMVDSVEIDEFRLEI